MIDFESKLKDPNLSVISDLSYKNRPLLIAFGGRVGALGILPFEFFNLTNSLDLSKIYLRDLSQTWYHSGLPGISENIIETVSFLKRKIDESGANRVVVFGNSMGGYAAILFGVLIGADVVHAFSPQTFIDDRRYIRSKNQIQNVHDNFSNKYFDLKKVISTQDYFGRINIYYDRKNKLDKKHAVYLKKSKNSMLHSFSGGGHGLIKTLREQGRLKEIVETSFNEVTDHAMGEGKKNNRSFFNMFFGGE